MTTGSAAMGRKSETCRGGAPSCLSGGCANRFAGSWTKFLAASRLDSLAERPSSSRWNLTRSRSWAVAERVCRVIACSARSRRWAARSCSFDRLTKRASERSRARPGARVSLALDAECSARSSSEFLNSWVATYRIFLDQRPWMREAGTSDARSGGGLVLGVVGKNSFVSIWSAIVLWKESGGNVFMVFCTARWP